MYFLLFMYNCIQRKQRNFYRFFQKSSLGLEHTPLKKE